MSLILDTFTRTNASSLGSADTGETWTHRPYLPYNAAGTTIGQATSVLGTDGDYAYSTDAAHGQMATINHGSGNAELFVDIDIRTNSLPDETGVGMTFRWQDSTHFWTAMLYNGAGSGNFDLFLIKQNGANFSDRTTHNVNVDPIGPGPTNTIRLALVLAGSSIGLTVDDHVNGVRSLNVTDSAFASAPHHGIHTYFCGASVLTAFNGEGVGGWRVGSIGFG